MQLCISTAAQTHHRRRCPQEDKQDQFRGGWFVCVLCSLLVLTLLVVIKSFEKLIQELANPYGDDPVDFPVLTFVTCVATETLQIVLHAPAVQANAILPSAVVKEGQSGEAVALQKVGERPMPTPVRPDRDHGNYRRKDSSRHDLCGSGPADGEKSP